MSRKAKISGPEKIEAIEKYIRGEDSLIHLATMQNLFFPSVKQWLQRGSNEKLPQNFFLYVLQDYNIGYVGKEHNSR